MTDCRFCSSTAEVRYLARPSLQGHFCPAVERHLWWTDEGVVWGDFSTAMRCSLPPDPGGLVIELEVWKRNEAAQACGLLSGGGSA
jgi:hypothetical protein